MKNDFLTPEARITLSEKQKTSKEFNDIRNFCKKLNVKKCNVKHIKIYERIENEI